MDAIRAAVFRPIARAGVLAAAISLSATFLTSSSAAAATVIGSPVGTTQCGGPIDTVQMTSTAISYAVPAGGGAITAWSTLAGADTGPAALLVWRPTATTGTYTLVGESPVVGLAANTLNQFTLAAPINVAAGDLIGLHLSSFAECLNPTVTGNTVGFSVSPTPALGGADAMTAELAMTLNVSATVGAAVTPPTGDGDDEQGGDQKPPKPDKQDKSHPGKSDAAKTAA